MAKKKKKIHIPEEEEVKKRLRKGKRFIRKERAELEEGAGKLKEIVDDEVKIGKKFVRKERIRLEEDIREHPVEYVAGALVVGFILGKLTK